MSNSGKPAKKGKGSRLCKTINTGKLYLKFKCVCPGHNNGNGTNTSGFSGLPGGFRFCIGNFSYVGSFGYWWSSSVGLPSNAWGRGLGYNNKGVIRNSFNKENGFCVRCLKDKDYKSDAVIN
jgi:uncharacterized protein (TIGR02145 family)